MVFDKKYGISRDRTGRITGIKGVNVYGSDLVKDGTAFTVPGVGIFVDPDVQMNTQLIMHEYGHILQANKVGLLDYYRVIAPGSVNSFRSNPAGHTSFWTETTANRLSYNYFGGGGPYGWNCTYFPFK